MDKRKETITRYYSGETTLAEEQQLKAAWRRGEFPGEALLGLRETVEMPEGLSKTILGVIRHKQRRKIRQLWITAGSIAALAVLIIFLRGTTSTPSRLDLQLSDNLKKERFENALRILGNALEEQEPPVQKVLYEDHNLIIAIE